MDKPTLLLTRPLASSERFVADLSDTVASKVNVVYSPLIEIIATGVNPEIKPKEAVIFTSGHAVELTAAGQGRAAYCVGERTAQLAQAKGWSIETVAQDAAGLIAQFEQMGVQDPVVHLSGRHRRGDVVGQLAKMGVMSRHVTLYDQTLCDLTQDACDSLTGSVKVIVPLFSPRTAAHFADQSENAQNLHIVALSAAVADAVRDIGAFQCLIASAPNALEMRKSIEKLVS